MIIRRYLGKNAQEAMLKIKMDLGSEVMILNTRKVKKKGLKSLFSKPMVEVLAAVDSEGLNKKDTTKSDKKSENSTPDVNEKNNFNKKEEKFVLLENKVNSIEATLEKIYKRLRINDAEDCDVLQDSKTRCRSVMDIFYNNLIKNEVEAEIAGKIIDAANESIQNASDVNKAAPAVFNSISNILGKPETIKLREDGKPTVIIFVGPTGVGKTTTLAKIAAKLSLSQKKNVGLITGDTYRIAAVDQLKTYAEILGMPLSIAYSVSEIKDAINSYSDKDIILIDTAGRSHKNKEQFEELKAFVEAAEADEVFLLLSATTGASNSREILQNYSFMKNCKMIFTKLDEASSPGIILNARFHTKMNLSYVTNGQSVPDDIDVADVDEISKMLLGSIVNNGSGREIKKYN